jgi:ribulose-5-phosphate 4-epimerase/fuculose-1-phosphate aldolase
MALLDSIAENVLLLFIRRGHGLTVVAEKIEDVVMRCIYTLNNAAMQTTALITRSAYLATASQEEASQMRPMQYLSPTEAYDAMQMNMGHAMRPWKLWCREVESDPLYVNHG